MALTGPIPLPEQGSQVFAEGMNNILKNLIARRLKERDQAQTANYQNALIDINKQKLSQAEALQPLRMDLLRAKIDSQKSLANQRNTGIGGLSGGADIKDLAALQKVLMEDHPGMSFQEAGQLASRALNGEDINLSGRATYLLKNMNKRTSDVSERNQQRYASTVEDLIKNADENASGAVQYSGLIGMSGGSSEKAKQLLGGEASPNYQKYINFTRIDVPTIAGEVMRELGVNASDEQKRLYKSVVNPITWDNNPQLALKNWEYFKKMARTVGKSVSRSPIQNKQRLKQEETTSPKKWKIVNGQLIEE